MKSKKEREFRNNLISSLKTITYLIEKSQTLKNKDLIEICRSNGIEFITTANDVHLLHELLETAINQSIVKNFNRQSLTEECQSQTLERLTNLLKSCPPQSWRGQEQIRLQQFSTPPTIAFLMARILNPLESELIIEPSAGTGSLAAWLRIAGCRVCINELSEMRRKLLELQGYEPMGINAEFLNDLLPEELEPDGFLMNPPFSTSSGRTKNNNSDFGFRHIKSALSRLKKGGRLVALLGSDTVTKTDKGRIFLKEIAAEYDLKAVISLPVNAYYKYGTNFQTCIVCIEKSEKINETNQSKKTKSIIEKDCRSLEECLSFAQIFD